MSAAHISPKQMAFIYDTSLCVFAVAALLVYDWLLCLDQEVRYIWKWRSRLTISTVVYAWTRYGMLLHNLLVVATVYPMSDLRYSCAADLWAQTVAEVFSVLAFSAFSALRAYVLSNRNIWLTAFIILLAIPPGAIFIAQCFYQAPVNLPSPFNCSADSTLPAALEGMTITLVTRVSQLAIEVLVVGLTWWYSYQSYRVRKHGGDIGKSLSSILIYNGSIYFLFLAALYTLDIIFQTASVPRSVLNADNFMQYFYDPITSILVCHFMLSLREFDANLVASPTYPGTGSQSVDHTVSEVLQFGALPSESLPPFIASFAHPVHVDWTVDDPDADTDARGDGGSEWREMDVVANALETPSWQSLAPDHKPEWERAV